MENWVFSVEIFISFYCFISRFIKSPSIQDRFWYNFSNPTQWTLIENLFFAKHGKQLCLGVFMERSDVRTFVTLRDKLSEFSEVSLLLCYMDENLKNRSQTHSFHVKLCKKTCWSLINLNIAWSRNLSMALRSFHKNPQYDLSENKTTILKYAAAFDSN